MTSTARLNLPLIDAGQAQKNITHNEAILALDQFVQAAVLSQTLATPPATNNDGDSYIVAAPASGAWAGKTGQIAAFQQGVWNFYVPAVGCLVWVVAQSRIYAWTGTAWVDAFNLFSSTLQNMQLLGIGTTANASNPLAAKLNAALFTALGSSEGGSGDMRFTLNKSATGNTVSHLYQDGYSGRAETGLCGDDHFHIKVSPDGLVWRDAVNIDPASGALALIAPLGVASGGTAGTTPAAARTAFGLDGYMFRNRLRNANFAVNQRVVSGTVSLSAGQYGHDGVKGGASGCTYTFSTSGLDTTISISAGSLILPIEAALIEGGNYVLSHVGSAQARVWQGTGASGSGAYGTATTSSPLFVTGLAAGTQTNVEFSTGTVLRPQLEPGSIATAYERRPFDYELSLCHRYFFSTLNDGVAPGTVTNNSAYESALASAISGSGYGYAQAIFPKKMRSAPTVTLFDGGGAQGKVSIGGNSYTAVAVDIFQVGFGAYQNTSSTSWPAGSSMKYNFTASAEI